MTGLEILKAAREKIADRKHWTRKAIARAGRNCVRYYDPKADRWCALGAMKVVADNPLEYLYAVGLLADVCGEPISTSNDSHSHAEVLALFDKAIASLEAK